MQVSGMSVIRRAQCTDRLHLHALGVNNIRDGEHDGCGDQALDGSGQHLADGDQRNRQRCQHPVLDLFGIAELVGQGQSHCLNSLEHNREAHHAGHQNGSKCGFAGKPRASADTLPDLREHVQKNEDQEEGLDERAGDEYAQVLSQHCQVA